MNHPHDAIEAATELAAPLVASARPPLLPFVYGEPPQPVVVDRSISNRAFFWVVGALIATPIVGGVLLWFFSIQVSY